ncbi:hypothetical protein LV779_07370 [Streptomyces thinghirensis]|nr:hypothetical protein [Streptomyces thinghirensis]
MKLADRIDSGKVHINEQTVSDEPNAPFGGVGAQVPRSRFRRRRGQRRGVHRDPVGHGPPGHRRLPVPTPPAALADPATPAVPVPLTHTRPRGRVTMASHVRRAREGRRAGNSTWTVILCGSPSCWRATTSSSSAPSSPPCSRPTTSA